MRDFSASTYPIGPVAEASAMLPWVATLCGEPAAPAAAISETAPYAAVRRVFLSWSVRLMPMVTLSLDPARPRVGAARLRCDPEPAPARFHGAFRATSGCFQGGFRAGQTTRTPCRQTPVTRGTPGR